MRVATLGLGTIIGGSMLFVGAALVDLGQFVRQPGFGSVGNALSALAGLGLLCLPCGLRARGIGRGSMFAPIGTLCFVAGTVIVSLVDVPAIFDPANLSAGEAFGPLGLVLLSLSFLAWFVAVHRTRTVDGWQKWVFLGAGLWFFVSFPIIQLPFFVIPYGQPLFVLLAGVYGILQVVIGTVIRHPAAHIASAPIEL